MKKFYGAKISSIRVTASVESPEQIIIPKGWGISDWENFFISRRDAEYQIPATKAPCEAARMLLKWAGTCRAELISVADEVGLWVFTFGFDSAKDASEFLAHVEETVVLDLSVI